MKNVEYKKIAESVLWGCHFTNLNLLPTPEKQNKFQHNISFTVACANIYVIPWLNTFTRTI